MTRRPTRGLALAAVSALTLTGLATASPAHAAAPTAGLLSQYTGLASTKFDPSTQIRLTAEVTPGVEVVFAMNPDPEAADDAAGWFTLGTTTPSGPYVTLPWDGFGPGGRSYVGERVALRVVAIDGTDTTYSTRRNVEISGGDSSVEAVQVGDVARYFTQPYTGTGSARRTYAQVNGSTSALDGTVELSWWRSSTGAFAGATDAEVRQTFTKGPDGFDTYGAYDGVLDITGFDADAGTVVISGERDSDDVVAAALVPQVINNLYVESNPPARTGTSGEVRLGILDTTGFSVTGAEVRRGDGTLVGYTDERGVVTTTQAAGTTVTYYVNATDADPYLADDGDKTVDATVEAYDPAPFEDVHVFADGKAFDRDEYTAGDVAVQVNDQQGRPVGAGVPVQYKLYVAGEEAPFSYSTATTGADGRAPIPVPAGASGEYELITRLGGDDIDNVSTFVTGQAAIVLNPSANPAPAAAGGRIDYVGRLVVGGEPLPGRRVDLTYRRGYEVVPGNQADAGIVTDAGLALRSTVTTNGNGSFRVSVDDPAETPQATEKGGLLTAATGPTVATEESTVAGNAGARDTSTTAFGTAGPGLAKVVVKTAGKPGAGPDTLAVTGPTSLAGERVKVLRVTGSKRTAVATKRLDGAGDLPQVVVRDLNGARPTTYVVQVVASKRARKSESNRVSVR